MTNGTIAIQIAIKALKVKGEVITTPFSYVATTSSIVWENCKPVFVDIDADTFNIDPKKIEAAITDKTTAIIATHVYGNPCDIDAIDAIAKQHNLKVIYDAAHCFGTLYKGQSVLNYGDVSTTSFHSTKLFHSIEGGAVVTQSPQVLKAMSHMRNFGHDGPEKFQGVGINGKNSEMHAAMGLVNLNYIESIIQKRKTDHQLYDSWLSNLGLQKPIINEKTSYNCSYYPLVFKSQEDCLLVFDALAKNEIGARRYFYPLLSDLNYVNKTSMPVAKGISERVLCLPLYQQLTSQEIQIICSVIIKTLKR